MVKETDSPWAPCRDPTTGEVLCDDIVENRGHHYGAELPDEDKEALASLCFLKELAVFVFLNVTGVKNPALMKSRAKSHP